MGLLRRTAEPVFQALPVPSRRNSDGDRRTARFDDADLASLAQELEELRAHVKELEAELDRYRSQEQLVNETLVLATSYSARVRHESRSDAELILRKARTRADSILGGLERERSIAERELVRLQTLAEETRTRLSTFLSTALTQLSAEATNGEGAGYSAGAAGLAEVLGDVVGSTRQTDDVSASEPRPWLKRIKP